MDLALNKLQRLICHKTKQTKPINPEKYLLYFHNGWKKPQDLVIKRYTSLFLSKGVKASVGVWETDRDEERRRPPAILAHNSFLTTLYYIRVLTPSLAARRTQPPLTKGLLTQPCSYGSQSVDLTDCCKLSLTYDWDFNSFTRASAYRMKR